MSHVPPKRMSSPTASTRRSSSRTPSRCALEFAPWLEGDERPTVVVLDGNGITQIDITALYALDRLRDELKALNVRLVLAGFPGPVRDRLEAAPAAEAEIEPFEIYATVDEAYSALNPPT